MFCSTEIKNEKEYKNIIKFSCTTKSEKEYKNKIEFSYTFLYHFSCREIKNRIIVKNLVYKNKKR